MIFLLQKRVFVAVFVKKKLTLKENYSFNRPAHTWEEFLLCLNACSFPLAIKEIW